MTLGEALTEVYSTTDEQDDLKPYSVGTTPDLTTSGALRLLGAFRTAASIVAAWKFPNGTRLRFRVLEDEVYVKLSPKSGTFANASPGSKDVAFSATHQPLDLTGAYVKIVDPLTLAVVLETFVNRWTPGTSYLDEAIPVGYTGLTYELRSPTIGYSTIPDDFSTFSLRGRRPIEWISFFDMTNGRALSRGGAFETFASTRYTAGFVTSFTKHGNGIIFDRAPDAVTLLVRYLRGPLVGSTVDADLCDLPEAFHDVVVQWTRHWAFSRGGDIMAAREAWTKLNQLLAVLRTQLDFETDYAESRLEFSTY